MYSKIIAVGRLQESAIMHVGDVKDVIVFRLYPDNTPSDGDDLNTTSPLECRYEVFSGDDYLLSPKPNTIVFVESNVFLSESTKNILECIVNKIFMIAKEQIEHRL